MSRQPHTHNAYCSDMQCMDTRQPHAHEVISYAPTPRGYTTSMRDCPYPECFGELPSGELDIREVAQ